MELIFREVLIVFLPFQVSSSAKTNCHDFIANDEWLQFNRSQTTGLSGLGVIQESGHKLQPVVPEAEWQVWRPPSPYQSAEICSV